MRALTDRELLALSSCTCLLIYFVPGEIAGVVHVLLFGTKAAFMLYLLVRDRHGFLAPPRPTSTLTPASGIRSTILETTIRWTCKIYL